MANLINIGGGAGGSSGGGHTILDNGGTSLTQRAELQFKGAYSEDNSTDEVTEVNVIRSMTKAEFDLLSNDEKVGIINVTDERGSADRNYSETTLWSGSETPTTSGTQITLSDNISNYDEIVFVLDTDYVGTGRFLVSELTIGGLYIATIYAPNEYGAYWSYDSDTTVTIKRFSGPHPIEYVKVIGIKYGNGTQTFHTYSTAEQVVGTWIDGKTLYEKTVAVTQGSSETYISLSGLNIDTFFVESAYIKSSSGDITPTIYYVTGSDKFMYFYNRANNRLVIQTSWQGSGYITIRYTKSTT